jgi:hypothetical protein
MLTVEGGHFLHFAAYYRRILLERIILEVAIINKSILDGLSKHY